MKPRKVGEMRDGGPNSLLRQSKTTLKRRLVQHLAVRQHAHI